MSGRELQDADRDVVTERDDELKPPRMYRVLLHNDDYTTMEFVVQVLESVFHHSHDAALAIMLHIHRKGVGAAGVYTFDLAETKIAVVEAMARGSEFPLQCSLEEA